MVFLPREVVVVMHLIENLGAEEAGDLLNYPVAARIGVAPCELHRGDVLLAKLRILAQQHRIDVDAVPSTGRLDEVRGQLVAEAA